MYFPVNVSTIQKYVTSLAFDGDPDIHLPCRVSPEDRVIWMYIKSSNAPQIVIFNGTSVDALYANSFTVHVDQRTRYYNLTLNNVRLNQSGWFICMEDTRSIFMQTTRLTVMGKYQLSTSASTELWRYINIIIIIIIIIEVCHSSSVILQIVDRVQVEISNKFFDTL